MAVTTRRTLATLAALFLLLWGAAAAAPRLLSAQQLPAGVTEQAVVERLRESGLTREQARSRLQQMGRDPALADRFYDAMERDDTLVERPASRDVLEAFQGIGVVLRPAPPLQGADTLVALDDTIPGLGELTERGLPIFGRDLFRLSTSQFQPVTTGPVDPGYRLGPGDQLIAVLTGDVELAHTLEVNREGLVVIPDVGQVYVAGLTLRELEDRLYERLGRVYSGVGRGAGASTQLGLSMGALRSNQVFLVGEVERPGAYQVSSVATVFNALYQARGPNENGSFRRIEVRRAGRTVRTVDVYDYLLRGDSRDDIRLEQGDIVFVPVVGRQVAIEGAIRRAAWFELREGESLRELLAFAGGMQPGASIGRLQIDRIVPPEQRRPGVDRVIVDVDVRDALRGGYALQDHDQVFVFHVAEERRNRLAITGGVRRPGLMEWRPGMTLWDAIDRAEGLHEFAYTARAHVYRFNPEDGTRNLLQAPLFRDAGGTQQHLLLADRDSVVVFSRSELRNPESVRIAGFVKQPGVYTLAPGMSVRDLILAADGFAPGADETEAELARRTDINQRTDRTAVIVRVPLTGGRQPAVVTGAGTGSGGSLNGYIRCRPGVGAGWGRGRAAAR
jgi:polysaccharide biosynthesis/export protein